MDPKIKENWRIGTTAKILQQIHHNDINIVIYERDIRALNSELNSLIERQIEFRSTGNINTIIQEVASALCDYTLIIEDIKRLLYDFSTIAKTSDLKLFFATINTNMCRRFHTDVNDLRLLCTYRGPGTLWLPDDNINNKALETFEDNEKIVIEEHKIQQAKTGSVVILKGAIYPSEDTKAAVHRSPTIEESSEQRLLLRIDTQASLNLWK